MPTVDEIIKDVHRIQRQEADGDLTLYRDIGAFSFNAVEILIAEIERLRPDEKRLDWLEEQGADVSFHLYDGWKIRSYENVLTSDESSSLRKAIDAARAREQGEPSDET